MSILKKAALLLWILLLTASCAQKIKASREVALKDGRVFLSRALLDHSPLLEVTGQAGFYWNQFIDPRNPPPMTGYTPVNEDWGGLYPYVGDASLRIILDKEPLVEDLAVTFNTVYSAYRMYVNGELVLSSGKPSLEKGRRVLQVNRQEMVLLENRSGPVDIVFHISNPYYHRNGIKELHIGTSDGISNRFYWNLFTHCLILGILTAMALYHFILTFSKVNRTYILAFSLLTLAIAFRYFTITSKLILDVLPQMSFTTWDRFQRLGIYPIAAFFISYMYHMFPRLVKKVPVVIVQILTGIFCLLSFLMPPRAVSGWLFTAFYPILIFAVLYGFFIMILALIKKEDDAVPMAIGVLSLILAAVVDMLIDRDVFPSYTSYQLSNGMLVFIFVQAYVISRRLNRAYTNEKRFREALQGVQSRLELTVEGAQLGLVEWDILHNTWYLNENFSQMIGFRTEQFIFNRRRWLELIHSEDVKEIDSLLKGALTGKIGNFRREYRLRMSGGSYRWCLLLGKVIQQNRLGGAEWFVGLHIDISDKKDL